MSHQTLPPVFSRELRKAQTGDNELIGRRLERDSWKEEGVGEKGGDRSSHRVTDEVNV